MFGDSKMSSNAIQMQQDKRKKIILTLHQELYSIISKEAASSKGIKPNPRVLIQHKVDANAEIGKAIHYNRLVNLLTYYFNMLNSKSVICSLNTY